jgi:hypothetical protein
LQKRSVITKYITSSCVSMGHLTLHNIIIFTFIEQVRFFIHPIFSFGISVKSVASRLSGDIVMSIIPKGKDKIKNAVYRIYFIVPVYPLAI